MFAEVQKNDLDQDLWTDFYPDPTDLLVWSTVSTSVQLYLGPNFMLTNRESQRFYLLKNFKQL